MPKLMAAVIKRVTLLLTILLSISPAHAFIEWNNSYTNDKSTNFSVPKNTAVTFSVSLNQSSNVTWYLNNTLASFEEYTANSNFTYNFSVNESYKVNASSEANKYLVAHRGL